MTSLADCDHPEDQQQACLAVDTGSRFVRCADCGAVRYQDEPHWVRPVLVAHTVHAERAMEVPQPNHDDVDPETIIRMHLDGRPSRKYIPVDGAELKEIVDVAVARATEDLTSDEWDDDVLPEDDAIKAAFPTRSGKHDAYAEAMRLVGAKRSKGALVKLVTWLIVERDAAKETRR